MTGGGILNNGTLAIQNSTITGNQNGSGVGNGGRGQAYDASTVNSLKPGAACFYSPSYSDPFYGYQPPVTPCSYFYSDALTIYNSTISKNSTHTPGSAVFNFYGTISINSSTISGNKATLGDGLFNSAGFWDSSGKYFAPGQINIVDSTISKNSAVLGGWGVI